MRKTGQSSSIYLKLSKSQGSGLLRQIFPSGCPRATISKTKTNNKNREGHVFMGTSWKLLETSKWITSYVPREEARTIPPR